MGCVIQHLDVIEVAGWRDASSAANAALGVMQCKPLRRNLSVTFDAPAQRHATSNPRPNARKSRDRLGG